MPYHIRIASVAVEVAVAVAAGAAAAAAVTPHFSSNAFESSAASITVNADRSSTIFSIFAAIFFSPYKMKLLN
jgi:hypothetical protein